MRNVAAKVARQLCDLLNNKGIKTESDFVLRPINKTLRHSWYVEKLKQCGHTDCIHVGISNNILSAFFAVTEDGHIMTGGNIMLLDAFAAMSDSDEFIMARPHMFRAWGNEYEDTCVITNLKGVKSFFDMIKFAEDED